jgi:hypothetical protein
MNFFNKLCGGRKKESMTLPPDLSTDSKSILKQLGFSLPESLDRGMWKYYDWANSEFHFRLTNDRGYYDCEICFLNTGPDFRMSLIPFLKFLKNDRTFYNKELKEANLSNTLTPDGYVELLDKNYDLINTFFRDYHPDQFENYKKFDFDYDSI